MKRFKSILVVCQDDSQPEIAIERARSLALQNGAKVKLVDVMSLRETEMANIVSEVRHESQSAMNARLTNYHRDRLAGYERTLRDAGIETTTELLNGVVFVEIVRAVLRDNHDLVIKATDPNLEFKGRQIFGSFDMHLMRKCPCPVWVLRKQFNRQDLNVLAAVDPDASVPGSQVLNRLIMDLSTSICPAPDKQLHVVNAWALSDRQALFYNNSDEATPKEIEDTRESLRKLREQALDQLTSQYPQIGKDGHVHLVQGPAEEVVPEFANKHNTDLVVMGTVSRTDIPGMFMGGTAELILSSLDCSVLAVKPPNFKTPISLDFD